MFFFDNLENLKSLVEKSIDGLVNDRIPITMDVVGAITGLPHFSEKENNALRLMLCGIATKEHVSTIREFIRGVSADDYRESSVYAILDFLDSFSHLIAYDEDFSSLEKYDEVFIRDIFEKIENGGLSKDPESTKFIILLITLLEMSNLTQKIKNILKYNTSDL